MSAASGACHPRSIRLEESNFNNPDNHANNPALSLSCSKTFRKEDTEADFNAIICLIFQTMKGHSKIVEKNYKVTFL